MRRFEYVSGGSEKFWEIDRDGSSVTIRFGRLGSDGQTQIKNVASEAAAVAQADKLIAEKIRKGYAEVATNEPESRPTSPKAGIELPDEDSLDIPAGWRRILHPRRGGVRGPAIKVDPGAARRLVDEVVAAHGDRVAAKLCAMLADRDAATALADLRAGNLTSPFETACAAIVVDSEVEHGDKLPRLAAFVDEWMAERGIAFTARSVAEYYDLRVGWTGDSSNPEYFRVRRSDGRIGSLVSEDDDPGPIETRFRAYLAVATEEDYQEAITMLAEHRHEVHGMLLTAFLVPERADWAAEASAALPAGPPGLLLCSVGSIDAFTALPPRRSLWWVLRTKSTLPTLVEGVGPAIAPTLAGWFDSGHFRADMNKRLLEVLTVLPTDEAFDLLVARLDQQYVRPALIEATRRFPVRAIRLLAKASVGTSKVAAIAADLLHTHVLGNQALVTAARPGLPADALTEVDKILSSAARGGAVDLDALPALLVDPPWIGKRAAAEPVVIGGLESRSEAAIAWAPGERDTWADKREWKSWKDWNWDEDAKLYDAGERGNGDPTFFSAAPEHLVRPRIAGWRPDGRIWWADSDARSIVARYELDALPAVLHIARTHPALVAGSLLPFTGDETAAQMAAWLGRLKSVRSEVHTWFRRHPGPAVRSLVPSALAKPGRERKSAEDALRFVASITSTADVVAVAGEYGDAAAAAIERMITTDPLDLLPARIPKTPEWADPALLPPILHRDGPALPAAATGHVLTMLAMSRPYEVYGGLDVVKEICDPASLAEFGWALFQRWQSAGLPTKEGWALDALGWIGDDETVRRLAPLIRSWPGDGGHARAVTALDVLVAIGSDVALMHLHGIAQKVKFKGLKTKAQEKIAEVAAALELTPEQLADRLVPDLGLDEDGSRTLDYGPRRFVVGFDEALKPCVTDEDGKRRKDLPKPGAHDDQELADAAYKVFAALKMDARTLVADQVRRLELAMVLQRRWTATEFHDLFVRHPLLWHIVRRLLWASFDGDRMVATFRVAEDRTLADAGDDTVVLAEPARVGIVHPLHLNGVLDTWSGLFADYEILQPFPQLGRAVYSLTDNERADTGLRRFEKITVPVGKVLGLTRRGWQRAAPEDGGIEPWIMRPLPHGRAVVMNLDPGLVVGAVDEFPEHEIVSIWLSGTGDGHQGQEDSVRFGELDPVSASEVLAELTELTT